MSGSPRIRRHAADCWTINDNHESAQIFVRHGKHVARADYPQNTTWVSVAILSSFGSWAHHWQHCGPSDWRNFLASLDEDYAMRKLMGTAWQVFSPEATLREARRSVIERRRTGELNRSAAREAWDEMNEIEADGERNETGIIRAFSRCDAFCDTYWDMSMHEPAAEGVAFWRMIWRPWVAHLIAEKAAA